MIARGAWKEARRIWLEQVSRSLHDDARVSGWGLVGSFGRGQQDEWSDLDILVAVEDADFGAFTDGIDNTLWSSADVFIDARRNAPALARSTSTIHIVSGLPVGSDWYVYPQTLAAWPPDCLVQVDRGAIPRTPESFDEWNGRGPRGTPLPIMESHRGHAQLAMVPIAAKYVIRGSEDAYSILDYLGARRHGSAAPELLEALSEVVDRLAAENADHVIAAMRAYLACVASGLP